MGRGTQATKNTMMSDDFAGSNPGLNAFGHPTQQRAMPPKPPGGNRVSF